jgi:outer membrane protein assembly factor BamE (lipoprotein component of BamABCDE complex)
MRSLFFIPPRHGLIRAATAAALAILGLAAFAGCTTANTRISEHTAEYASLDPATQAAIKRGEINPGYTTDMVYMALGRPLQTTRDASGETVWVYHHEPPTAYNETIHAGFRRRVVYDPVKRSNDIIIEPIDTKAFPNLVPYNLRLTFQNDRLVRIDRQPAAWR